MKFDNNNDTSAPADIRVRQSARCVELREYGRRRIQVHASFEASQVMVMVPHQAPVSASLFSAGSCGGGGAFIACVHIDCAVIVHELVCTSRSGRGRVGEEGSLSCFVVVLSTAILCEYT